MARKQKPPKTLQSEEERLLLERRKASIRSMYFNRYLLLRYAIAVFFFANILLAIAGFPHLCAIAAIILLLSALRPLWLLGTANGKKQIPMKSLQIYFGLQTIWLICALCQCIWGNVSDLFPFFNNTSASRTFLLCLLGTGSVLDAGCLWKVMTISSQTDRTLQKIRFYEAKYHLD